MVPQPGPEKRSSARTTAASGGPVRPELRPRLAILAAALLFSTGGVAVKATEVGPWPVAGLRCAIGAAALLLLLPRSRAGLRLSIWPVSLAYALTLILFVLANKLTTAANAIFIQYTAPVFVLLLAPLLLREPIRPGDRTHLLWLAGGLGLVFLGAQEPQATAPSPALGNLLAVGTSLTWAATLMGLRWLATEPRGRGDGGAAAVVLGNLIGLAICLPMMLPWSAPSGGDWLWIGYLGVFQIGLAYALVTAATPRVGALELSLLLLLEPVLSPLWTWLVHGEAPGAWSIAGGTIVVVATGLRAFRTQAPAALADHGSGD